MSNSRLPERASLEYLKKLAKDRLRQLRQTAPQTKLAVALTAVAQEHGFPNWRALKSEVERRQRQNDAVFFEACSKGDADLLRSLIAGDPSLIRASNPDARHPGWTGLHTAAQAGHVDAVRLLLEQGADPNARESGDNTCPLHWAAAEGRGETVRLLIDAGADVHAFGDVHELDAIGWATLYARAESVERNRNVVSLLLAHGAQHNIFSAIVTGDLDVIRELVEHNPEALDRRMSRFEQGLTALHFAIKRKRYDILDLLIDLGADLEVQDRNGHTALESAMLRGDREAMRRLQVAGAKQPTQHAKASNSPLFAEDMAKLETSVKHGISMIRVPDVARTLAWYVSIGFREIGRHEDNGVVNWGIVKFGKAELMLSLDGKQGAHDVSLWFYTDQVEKIYELLKARQLDTAQDAIDREPAPDNGIEFVQHLYDPFYGGREFGVRDLNGYELYFRQPAEW